MPELPTGTVTFLFTDIAGSTKLLQQLGAEAYGAALAEHRRLLRGAFARHGGVEIDTQGDAFFVAFPTAPGAVAAARTITEGLGALPIAVRVGVHTGTPLLTKEGYVGEDVHLGARIAAAGHGGQVLMSKQTRELVDGGFTDLGEHRVRDFDAPVWIYQLGQQHFPPLKTISNTNLPRPASSFVGREREVAEISALLQDGARLVTLTGPGGTGKTRLALEVAAALLPEFRSGTFWVDLSPVRDEALVTPTICRTLGAKTDLAGFIGEREMLLVLDNLEQVVGVAPEMVRLVQVCPNLRFLATSRERLRVRDEVPYAVAPLNSHEASTLFAARSGLATDGIVVELCQRLEGLPLAIELAAARSNVLSPRQMLERLSSAIGLAGGGRDLTARQQTLRATIQWSYGLLTRKERRLFAGIAVFRGGWTLEAAEAVVRADPDVLLSLVDKSMVQHQGERFSMLEMVRQYAGERLEASGVGNDVRGRHGEFYLKLATTVRASAGLEPALWTRLEAEHENLRAALAWLVEAGDRARGLLAVRQLWLYWLTRGFAAEGNEWARQIFGLPGLTDPLDEGRALTSAGELARVTGDLERAAQLKLRALQHFHGSADELEAATSRDLSDILIALGDIEAADGYAHRALALRRAMSSPEGVAHALEGVARVEWHKGHPEEAVRLLEEAVSLEESCDAAGPTALADTLWQLADYQRRMGLLRDAAANLRRSLNFAFEAGDLFELAWCLRDAGSLFADVQQPATAARIWGALETLRLETGISFAEQPSDFESQQARVRRVLGDIEYERLLREGAEMARQDTQRLALEGLARVTE